MLSPRVIPCLLLSNGGFVKTTRFAKPTYLGDPINIVKIFNEKFPDEIIILDISKSFHKSGPDFQLLEQVVGESFVPLTYGGGVQSVEHVVRLLGVGIEKVVINTAAFENPSLIQQVSALVGRQSVVVCFDILRTIFGEKKVMIRGGKQAVAGKPIEWAKRFEELGAGEVMIQSIDRDGTMRGFDLELIKEFSRSLSIPLIACGGAGSNADLRKAINEGGSAAVAAGSLFVYQGVHKAVLISFPTRDTLEKLFKSEF